jgi:MFS family permease
MLGTTLANFRLLRREVKIMLYLHWLYSAVSTLTGMFIQIFLYQRFASVEFNALTQAIYYSALAIGFSGSGFLAARYRWDIKWGYPAAFFLMATSYLFFFGQVSKSDARWFTCINGLGFGLYWLTMHSYELTSTKNEERDYYSSLLSAGSQVIGLAAPALATLLIFVSDDLLQLGSYTLLFIAAPLLYLCGLPLLGRLPSYRPEPIRAADWQHFLHDKRNRLSQIYFLGGTGNFVFAKLGIPIASIIFFGSEKNVGLWNTLFAVLAMFALLQLSRHRHSGNRLKILSILAACMAALAVMVGVWFSLGAFLIYSLAMIVLAPMMRVSEHVIDLQTMETMGRQPGDFFPTMVFRDLALGMWRVLCLLLFASLVHHFGSGDLALKINFFALAISVLLMVLGAWLLYRKRAA